MRGLTPVEQQRIQDAVARAEAGTSGEIVPYIVAQSDTYDAAIWKAASFFAVLAMAIVVVTLRFYQGWGLGWLHSGWGPVLVALGAGSLGAMLARFVPAVMRYFAGERAMLQETHRRAMQAFVEEEVFRTRDRTGILLFVSLLEHRIEVFGDSGISSRLKPEDWADVIAAVREGIVDDRLADGIARGVELCGELLAARGFEARSDDIDELPNIVRHG
jgi:putative membrane protein